MEQLQIDSRCCRSPRGWRAEATMMLDGGRQLTIATRKSLSTASRELDTTATMASPNESGLLTHRIGFGSVHGDYSRRVLHTTSVRVTEKVVAAQQAQALTHLAEILGDVKSHYERQAALEETLTAAG